MFSFSKKGWLGLVALALMVTLTAVQSFSATTSAKGPTCTCDSPSSFAITAQTSSSVTLEWSAVGGAGDYELWFVRVSDAYNSPHTTQKGTSITYTGLAPGRYKFYIKTICGYGTSDIIVMEDIIIG